MSAQEEEGAAPADAEGMDEDILDADFEDLDDSKRS